MATSWASAPEREAIQEADGGYLVRALTGAKALTREQAVAMATEMFAKGFTRVGVYKLHPIMSTQEGRQQNFTGDASCPKK